MHRPGVAVSGIPGIPPKRQVAGLQAAGQAAHRPPAQRCWAGQSASLPQAGHTSSTLPSQSSSTPLPHTSVPSGETDGSLSLQSPSGMLSVRLPAQKPSPSMSQGGTHRAQPRAKGTQRPSTVIPGATSNLHIVGSQVASHSWQTPLMQASWVIGQSLCLVHGRQPSSWWPLQFSSTVLPQISLASGWTSGLPSSQSPSGWPSPAPGGQYPSPSASQAGTQAVQPLPNFLHKPGTPLPGIPITSPNRQVAGLHAGGQLVHSPASSPTIPSTVVVPLTVPMAALATRLSSSTHCPPTV